MSLGLSYWDSCPECDSLNIKIEGEYVEKSNGEKRIMLYCRDCCAEWDDLDES